MRVQVTCPDCGLGNSFDSRGSGMWRRRPQPLPRGCARPAWDPLGIAELGKSQGSWFPSSAGEVGGRELWKGSVIALLSWVSHEQEKDTGQLMHSTYIFSWEAELIFWYQIHREAHWNFLYDGALILYMVHLSQVHLLKIKHFSKASPLRIWPWMCNCSK